MNTNIKVVMVDKVSKAGKPYTTLDIYLTDKVIKSVFLTDAEIALLRLTYHK